MCVCEFVLHKSILIIYMKDLIALLVYRLLTFTKILSLFKSNFLVNICCNFYLNFNFDFKSCDVARFRLIYPMMAGHEGGY